MYLHLYLYLPDKQLDMNSNLWAAAGGGLSALSAIISRVDQRLADRYQHHYQVAPR